MRLKLIFATLLIICWSIGLSASNYSVGGGLYNLGTTAQVDVNGDQGYSDFDSFEPGFSLGTVIPLWGPHHFTPEAGFVYHFRSTDDDYGEQTKTTLFILWDMGYKLNAPIVLRYGLGSFLTRISGEGGAVTVKNGNSTTTAYKPDKAVTSYNTTLNFGADFLINSKMSAKFETYMFSFLNNESRAIEYSFTMNWFF